MSVYRPPGAVYQLDWDPLDNSGSVYAMHPTATTTAGNQLSRRRRSVEENTFLDNPQDSVAWLGLGRSLNSEHRCSDDLISSDFCMNS